MKRSFLLLVLLAGCSDPKDSRSYSSSSSSTSTPTKKIEDRVDVLESDVGSLKSDVQSLNKKMNATVNVLDGMDRRLDNHERRIEGVEGRLGTLEKKYSPSPSAPLKSHTPTTTVASSRPTGDPLGWDKRKVGRDPCPNCGKLDCPGPVIIGPFYGPPPPFMAGR